MTAYELIDVSLSIANRIDMQWALFVTVHLALFGGVIYVDRPLRLTEKLAALFIYVGFAGLNYLVMMQQLTLLEHVYVEVSKLQQDVCCIDNVIILKMTNELKEGRFSSSSLFLQATHILMFILVLLAIVYDSARRYSKN